MVVSFLAGCKTLPSSEISAEVSCEEAVDVSYFIDPKLNCLQDDIWNNKKNTIREGYMRLFLVTE